MFCIILLYYCVIITVSFINILPYLVLSTTGMSRTHRNETISMLEGARTLLSNSNDGCSSSRYKKGNTMNDYVLIGDSCSGSGKGKYTSQQEQRKGLHQWKDDETLVVLDRLKEVTQKALQLEASYKVKYQYSLSISNILCILYCLITNIIFI